MIAIVCGGRTYDNAVRIAAILDAAVDRLGLHTIIEGSATGADALAKEWALARGDISVIDVPANWSAGKSAGHARNQLMLSMMLRSDDDKALFAFPGGTGTAHMVGCCEGANRTQNAKIRIIKIDF